MVIFCWVLALGLPGTRVALAELPQGIPFEPLEFETVTAPPLSWGGQVDRAFAKVVEVLGNVLFYEVFATNQEFVETHHVVHFVRPHGDAGPFQRRGKADDDPQESLTDEQVDRLALGGKLVADLAGGTRRVAKQGGREVEVVTLAIDVGQRYVWDAGRDRFRKQLPLRGLLSEDPAEMLTRADVTRWGERGMLVCDARGQWLQYRRMHGAPLVVLWLGVGAIVFTCYMRWFNLWGFWHAVQVVRGVYDDPSEPGEVTHFQALASALSATIGLGNIAGVTIAMTAGGPGAFFWMMAFGVLGMSSKFVECTLGQKYRVVKPDGTVSGGPMQYLHTGLAELGWGSLGLVLSTVFSVMCILGSIGGGNMFQANQSGNVILATLQSPVRAQIAEIDKRLSAATNDATVSPETISGWEGERRGLVEGMVAFEGRFRLGFGLVLAVLVGVVIVGGIRRIGAAAELLVPAMCVIYVAACAWIIVLNYARIPHLVAEIGREALTGSAVGGGFLGVLVMGVRRAAFSNEAGIGSAAIAHSAAKTKEPIREGTVALLEPFVDTVVVCSMTALVVLITGAWNNEAWIVGQGAQGTALTALAFRAGVGEWFTYVLALAVLLFAYSTIISWSYYGERCWERLWGERSILVFRVLYVACVCLGAVAPMGAVLDFSDMMILAMAFPNIIGCVILAPGVRRDLWDYWRRYRAGEFVRYR